MRAYGTNANRQPERALELAREARLSAVRLVRLGRCSGIACNEVARDLGVLPGTLFSWGARWRCDRLKARAVGRPKHQALSRSQRQAALWALHATGGRLGVKQLMQVVWPPAARSTLVELKARWRYAAHRRGGRLCAVVLWQRAGSVWATDWTDPDVSLEGKYKKILVTRDLSSGRVLQSLPCEREDGRIIARELRRLILKHGPPAVWKADNGRSMRCQAVQLVLAHYGILPLISPPVCPGYNGACEAGIGSLKVQAHHLAAAGGRELEWSCDDVEAARSALNERERRNGLSAQDSWDTRRPISERERERLWSRYRTHYAQERAARGIVPGARPEHMEQASLDRAAIARALEEEDLVCFRRRWIRPPIRGRKVSWKR